MDKNPSATLPLTGQLLRQQSLILLSRRRRLLTSSFPLPWQCSTMETPNIRQTPCVTTQQFQPEISPSENSPVASGRDMYNSSVSFLRLGEKDRGTASAFYYLDTYLLTTVFPLQCGKGKSCLPIVYELWASWLLYDCMQHNNRTSDTDTTPKSPITTPRPSLLPSKLRTFGGYPLESR